MNEALKRKICCLTLTGDRHETLNQARYYFKRSYLEQPVDWVVIDDGIKPYNPGDCVYFRRTPDGPLSLARQFTFAFEHLSRLGYTDIVICEDDDWYSNVRIQLQIEALNYVDLHGWNKSFYYNVKNRVYHQNKNRNHASLYESAMKMDITKLLVKRIKAHRLGSFIDIELWKIKCNSSLDEQNGHCVGIKGLPGRLGLGMGHKPGRQYLPDKELIKLKNLINKDVRYYEIFYEI